MSDSAIKNNKIVYGDTWNEFKSTDNVHIASVTKSIISLLIGIAIDKGMIESVNQNNVKISHRKYIC